MNLKCINKYNFLTIIKVLDENRHSTDVVVLTKVFSCIGMNYNHRM